jgi:LysM repeat protein
VITLTIFFHIICSEGVIIVYQRYVVREGDTIESIANQYNILAEEIVRANRLMPGMILRPGQELLIPPSKETTIFFPYEVKPGDNLYAIATRYNIKPEVIALVNGIDLNDYIYPGQILLIPKEGIKVYVTVEGDTINDVARIFNTTVNKLLLDNENIYLMEDQLLIFKGR